jgi:hypothetical protein
MRLNVITAQVGEWLQARSCTNTYSEKYNVTHGHYFVWPISSASSLRSSRPRIGGRRAGSVCTYSEPTGSGKWCWWNGTLSLDKCVRLQYPCSGDEASWVFGAFFRNPLQPSGHYMYRTVVTICTTSLTLANSTFCPHSCIYVFCVDLRTNSDYFHIQH